MDDDSTAPGIRALFDWRLPARDDTARCASADIGPVRTDDLALALQLLSCNARDKAQFRGPAPRAPAPVSG